MNDRYQRFNSGRVIFFLLAVITIILVAAVLRITSSVLLPFTIAVFLAIVISPMVSFLQKFRVPRVLSILLVLVFLIFGITLLGMILYSSGRSLVNLYPRYEQRITDLYILVASVFELPYDEQLSIFENIWGQIGVRNLVRDMSLSLSNGFISFLTDAFMVVIFIVFLLSESVTLKKKLDRAFEGSRAERIIRIASDIITQVTHYLSIKFFISLATGIFVGVCLSIIGVEFAAIWGLIQFVMNFIPNIGSIAAGLAATAFSLIQFWPEPMPIIATGIVMLSINMIIGNIVEPKVMGDRLGLSPLVVILSLLIWGWLWGFVGMILAVPLTVIIKIVCENIPVLEPISILMGSHKAAEKIKTAAEQNAEETAEGN